jgi:hypothetical protein
VNQVSTEVIVRLFLDTTERADDREPILCHPH